MIRTSISTILRTITVVHGRDHVTRLKPEQRDHPLKFAGFHNQSPLLTMKERNNSVFGMAIEIHGRITASGVCVFF